MKIDTGRTKEILDFYGESTKEWKEAQVRYGQSGGDLYRKIGISIGFE